MAILGKGPGPKKKNKNVIPPSKIGSKGGQTVVAPGYKLGLIRNAEHTKNPTKKITMGTGPGAPSYTQQQGIIGPIKSGPGKPVAAAPVKKKRTGRTAVGQALYNVKDTIGDAAYELKRYGFKNPFGGGGGRRKGGKTCAAYWNY
jgi:hypothetical protein